MMHRLLFGLAVMVSLSAGVWALGVPSASPDQRSHAAATDVLAVAHHTDGSSATLRSRTPVAGSALVQRTWAQGSVAAAHTRDGWTVASHRHAPLYALLNVYRL
ncbi:MAG: hypothetical protein ABIR79_14205 [Candidatus Binatia bacterium]